MSMNTRHEGRESSLLKSGQPDQHWHMQTVEHVILLTLDRADKALNTINQQVLRELEAILEDVQSIHPRGLVILSGKCHGFVAGADITAFSNDEEDGALLDFMHEGHAILNKLAALPIPTVAMIHGGCLGGGLELALACDYRIADDHESTILGLPEIKLGIHPGWGGTVRLPRLIGAPKALSMILSGQLIPAKRAQKWGVLDAVVKARDLKAAAIYYAAHPPRQRPLRLLSYNYPYFLRSFLAWQLQKRALKKINKAHYPAPHAVLKHWLKYGVDEVAMEKEITSVASLVRTDTCHNLIRLFFLKERLKTFSKIDVPMISHIHIIGAGTMGGDIAAWCALQGFYVTLQDTDLEKIALAMKRAALLYHTKLPASYLMQAALDRLQPDPEGYGVPVADLVLEAIIEDREAKQALLIAIEPRLKADAMVATNTSSIPLEVLQSVLKKPEKLMGMHFFNPVVAMPLVEVIASSTTDQASMERILKFVGQLSKLPLPVKSRPGFLVNRLLMPYLVEAMRLVEEGYAKEEVDDTAMNFGMPMGPIALSDRVGLDVCLAVAHHLSEHASVSIPAALSRLVEQGRLGKKTGQGFYQYADGKRPPASRPINAKDAVLIADRLILSMLNEAVAAWHERIVEDADLLDAGMVFGTGFAPFRGGPLHYAKQRGLDEIINTLKTLSQECGQRFTPHIGWSVYQEQLKPKPAK